MLTPLPLAVHFKLFLYAFSCFAVVVAAVWFEYFAGICTAFHFYAVTMTTFAAPRGIKSAQITIEQKVHNGAAQLG